MAITWTKERIARQQDKYEEYGRKRRALKNLWALESDEDITRSINDTMAYVRAETQKEIAHFVAKYGDAKGIVSMANARKRADSVGIDVLSKRAEAYINGEEDAFSPRARREMLDLNAKMQINRLELLNANLEQVLNEAGVTLEKTLYDFIGRTTRDEMEKQAGLLGLSVPDPEEIKRRADILARESVHITHFSDAIWDNQDELRKRLNKGIAKSILMGKNPTTWAQSLNGLLREVDIAAYKQRRIALSETGRVQSAIQQDSFKQAGYEQAKVICEPSACPVCAQHDGKVIDLKRPLQGRDIPKFHPFCRCSMTPYFDRAKLDAMLDAIAPPVDVTPDKPLVEKPKTTPKAKARGNKYTDEELEDKLAKLEGVMSEKDFKAYRAYLDANPSVREFTAEATERLSAIYKRSGAHYNPNNHTMTFNYDHEIYGKHRYATLAHEMGHAIDELVPFEGLSYSELDALRAQLPTKARAASASDEFLSAFRKDKANLLTIEDLSEQLMHADMANKSTGVQDAVRCITFGKVRVAWGHRVSYYSDVFNRLKELDASDASLALLLDEDAPPKRRDLLKDAYNALGFKAKTLADVDAYLRDQRAASETWATMFSAELLGDEAEAFEKFMPNTWATFKKIVGGK